MDKIYSCKYTKNGVCTCLNKCCFGTKRDTGSCRVFIKEGPKNCLKFDYMDSAQIVKNFIIISKKEDCDFWKAPREYFIGDKVAMLLGTISNQVGIAMLVDNEYADLNFGPRKNCATVKCSFSDLKETLLQVMAENDIYTRKGP